MFKLRWCCLNAEFSFEGASTQFKLDLLDPTVFESICIQVRDKAKMEVIAVAPHFPLKGI